MNNGNVIKGGVMSELIERLRLGASICRDRGINLDFAKLADEAAAALSTSRADVIEECAKVCDEIEEPSWHGYENPNTFTDGVSRCAAAIRALGDK